VREVISGNQNGNAYGMISGACVLSGVRLSFTAKPTLMIEEISARRLRFSYSGREGYVIKNPSYVARESAMLVIESALAMRRDGIKMPWSSIAAGLESASNTCCFDILSVSPAIIVDSASTACEIASVVETFEGTVERADSIVVCIMSQSAKMLKDQLLAFGDRKIKCLIVYGLTDGDVIGMSNATVCDKVSGAAKQVYAAYKNKDTVFCLGSVAFARDIKNEFIKLMGL
jgi:folylpolyglutamate synthase/dihydropteroate synthase